MEIRTVSVEDKSEKQPSEFADLEHEDEDEEEALSLSDLPVCLNEDEKQENQENQEDFGFELSGCGTLSSTSEMCSADDIFFKGQILPFRVSVSSENSNPKPQSLSRSESTEGFSSRSSSNNSNSNSNSNSQYTSNSHGSGCSTRVSSKPRIQNQFLTHSSPKPQIRISNSSINGNAASNRNRKTTTVWEFFRLGLVHTPEIELQDLKGRNSVSRNSSSSSSNSNGNSNNNSTLISRRKQSETNIEKQSIVEKRLLLSGCNCTVNSVKLPVSSNKINNLENEEKKKNHKKKKIGEKEGMLNRRTFEWIKELSISSFLHEEEEEEEGL